MHGVCPPRRHDESEITRTSGTSHGTTDQRCSKGRACSSARSPSIDVRQQPDEVSIEVEDAHLFGTGREQAVVA